MKRLLPFALQILFICLVLFASYYFFFLRPKLTTLKSLSQELKLTTLAFDQLSLDYLQWTDFRRLNPDNPTTPTTHQYLLDQLNTRSKKLHSSLTPGTELSKRHLSHLDNQQQLLNQLVTLNSYPAQLKLLNDSPTFFTDQEQLLKDYQQYLSDLNRRITLLK